MCLKSVSNVCIAVWSSLSTPPLSKQYPAVFSVFPHTADRPVSVHFSPDDCEDSQFNVDLTICEGDFCNDVRLEGCRFQLLAKMQFTCARAMMWREE